MAKSNKRMDGIAWDQDIVKTANLLRASSTLEGKFSKTKTKSITVVGSEKIKIACKISGTYFYDKVRKRCLFGTKNNPKFTVSGGTWTKREYSQQVTDAGRTVMVYIKGTAKAASKYSKKFSTSYEYAMNANGEIG